ncbi:MAG: M1 family aminopeptidase [Acidobacteria bacterium]|nr:M1 family aminopeptidase [Acidobacteriota bacterium]
MKWRLLAVSLVAVAGCAQTAAELGSQLRALTLDPEECYRVHELNLSREDLRFYFTDGYLIFSRPVAGRIVSAVFSADNEGGDAEVLVLPPNHGERASLANFVQSPNLSEHFRAALLLFTDGSGEELRSLIHAGEVRKSKDRGLLLADSWKSVVQNLAGSFQVRLVRDLLGTAARQEGVFFAAVTGERYGNFDLIYDPTAAEQITIGQVTFRQERAYFDTWSGFQARSFRSGQRKPIEPPFRMSNFRIEVTIDADLKVSAVTRAKLTPRGTGQRAAMLEISRRMAISGATIDGEKAEVFERESMRADLLRHDQNHGLLIVAPKPLEAGRDYELEIRHSGEVITDAGNGVYFVGARGGWYPRIASGYSSFDLTFRYPKALNLVATGEVVEERTEAEQRLTHVRSGVPIRLAGFNLGRFEKAVVRRGGYSVEIVANKFLERALERSRELPLIPARPPSRRMPEILMPSAPPPLVVRSNRLERMAAEIAEAFEFMAGSLGPPPLRRLTGSPIPGSFGQGYPGLLFLSTLYYLDPEERPATVRRSPDLTLFLDLLGPHETAHQWWGNAISPASYHDDWLMEAFANYMAMLYLEKKRGTRFVDSVLDFYRRHLLEKTRDGRTLESIGPITWGTRLETSASPDAWRVITYEKGSWILHMLRRRMGDERFQALLGELVRKFRLQPFSTEALRQEAKAFLPAKSPDASLEGFFDAWIYGTGIPSLQLECTIRRRAGAFQVSGSVTQSEVNEDFSTLVPIEIQFARGKSVTHWIQTASEPVKFSIPVRQQPIRVVMDPRNGVLAVKK